MKLKIPPEAMKIKRWDNLDKATILVVLSQSRSA
jgi:hypothetical protein